MNRTIALLVLALAIAFPLSLLAGRIWIDPASTPNAAVILMELRLPRGLLALLIGAGLGAAGAAMQGYLRNPLADPGLFGIAPGAALGAVASLWFGYSASAFLLPGFALAGASGAMALLALIAGRSRRHRTVHARGNDDRQSCGRVDCACDQPCAQRLCHERDRLLADGCADRPELGRRVAGRAAYPAWHSPAAPCGAGSRRADTGRCGCPLARRQPGSAAMAADRGDRPDCRCKRGRGRRDRLCRTDRAASGASLYRPAAKRA